MNFKHISLIVLAILVLVALVGYFVLLTSTDRRLLHAPTRDIMVGDAERTYRIFNTDPSDSPQPLVIGLHGLRDRALWFGAYTGLHQLGEEEGFALALPSGQRMSWNADICCGYAFQNEPEDVEFIKQMVEDIQATNNIDTERIYLMGFSNGGAMVQKLLAEAPGVYAGGVSAMSGVGTPQSQIDITNANGSRLLLLNGTDDQYVGVETTRDTNQFQFLAARETARIWAEQLDVEQTAVNQAENYTEYAYGDSLAQRIYNTSHRWPQWRLWSFSSEVPEATREAWRFLDNVQ